MSNSDRSGHAEPGNGNYVTALRAHYGGFAPAQLGCLGRAGMPGSRARLRAKSWISNIHVVRMNEGVEWALHGCLILAWLGGEQAVPAAKLAEYYELPPAYLNKQLQALARAEIVVSVPGPRGGFRLARPPEKITLMDVVAAIEGEDEAFRCTEIRQRGPGGGGTPSAYRAPCAISSAMRRAELAWRRELAQQTITDVMITVDKASPAVAEKIRRWFADARG